MPDPEVNGSPDVIVRTLEIQQLIGGRKEQENRLTALHAEIAESNKVLFERIREIVLEVVQKLIGIDASMVEVVPADAMGGVSVYPKGIVEIKVKVDFLGDAQKAAYAWFDASQNRSNFGARISRGVGTDLSNLHPSFSEAIPDDSGGTYQLLQSVAFEVLFHS